MTTGLSDVIGLMQGASGLISSLPQIFSLIEKIIYFTVCLFLGGLVMHGWKRYKNWGIKLIGSLVFGIICLIGGVLLNQVIPIQLPFLEGMLQAFMTAVMLYLILWLISGDHKELGKFVTTKEFIKLRKAFEKLTNELKKLKAMLERKKILPEKLSSKKLEDALKEFLKSKKITKYDLITKERKEEIAYFIIKDEKLDEYRIGFDFYTGDNVSFIQINMAYAQKIKKALRTLAKNDRMLAGVIIGIVLAVFMLLLVNEDSIKEITNKLSFTGEASAQDQAVFTNYSINDTSCLTIIDLLYIVNNGLYNDVVENVEVPQSISERVNGLYPNENLMTPLSRYTYESIDYLLVMSTSLTQAEFSTAMQNYIIQNPLTVMQGLDLCAFKHKGKSVDNYIHVCSANINETSICGCRLLADIDEYCFVFSNLLTSQITGQLGALGGQLSSESDLSGLLGVLGGLG